MKRYSFMLAILFAFMFIGCGGGGGSSDTPTDDGSASSVTISGIATDDPISNGTVVIKDLNGVELETINTDLNGSFSLEVDSSKITNGYMLSVSGGKIGNDDFNGTLNAVYTGSHDKTKANITLITSLIQKLSEDETGTALEKRDKAIKRLVDIGMIQNEDWFEENPKNLELPLLQSEVKSRGLTNWLNDMKSDLADNELSINSQRIFTRSHGGINRVLISPINSVSLFAGQTSVLYVSAAFLDNNESNITVTKTSGPSWATVDGTTLNIAPPETETNFTTYTLSIEVFANDTKQGRKKDITISLLKSIVLVTGELGTSGGRIENEWKDISISVDANKLSQNYTITYYGGLNENNEMSFWFKTTPDMNQTEMSKLNLKQPSYESIKNNYLMDEDAINRSLRKKTLSRSTDTKYGTIGHDYSQYSNSKIPNECKPNILGDKLNEMIWREANGDDFILPYVWQGNIAVFNGNDELLNIIFEEDEDKSENALFGGLPRVQPSKIVGDPQIKCASALRSQVKEDDPSIEGKEAVLFVHGFINSGNLGGYDLDEDLDKNGGEYFAVFPKLVKDFDISGEKLMPFVFQWRTNAKFEDVASELGRAVKQLKKATGKKVHIIAHSYGGLLSRTLVQGLASAPHYNKTFAEEHIASITTVGTPHSGVFGSRTTLNFNEEGDVVFPEGRNGVIGAGIQQCRAITCYQAGANDYLRTDKILQGNSTYGTKYKFGYVVYKLFQELDNYPNIPTQVLIGLIPASIKITKDDDFLYSLSYDFLDNLAIINPGAGDKLISVFGQRIIPDGDQGDLNDVYNANNIEEHILHMDATKDTFYRGKDDYLFSLFETNGISSWDKENYAENIEPKNVQNYMFGYSHRTSQYNDRYYAKAIYKEGTVEDTVQIVSNYLTMNSEVGLQNCNNAQTCGHPTWSYFKTFLQDKVEVSDEVVEDETIFVSGKVLQNEGIPEESYTVNIYVNSGGDNKEQLVSQVINGTSDYNISVEFRPKTETITHKYYVEIIPQKGSDLRDGVSNIIITNATIAKSSLVFDDIILVEKELKTGDIAISLKDVTSDILLSDFNISIYKGDILIKSGQTDSSSYTTSLGVGYYTCKASKPGYKESALVPCYFEEGKTNFIEISTYNEGEVTEDEEFDLTMNKVNISIIDSNRIQDEYFDLYINNNYIGAVENPPGGTVTYENISLDRGINKIELRITNTSISDTKLTIRFMPDDFSKIFMGNDISYEWFVTAP